MQMVKIQIPDKKESAKALVETSRRGRVECFANDVYIVPEPALELLANLGITYQKLYDEALEPRGGAQKT